MNDEQRLARLIGWIYDAGLGVMSWDTVLDQIMPAVGAEASALFVEDRSSAPSAVQKVAVRGYPDGAERAYASHFADRDVRLPAVLRLPAGQIYADDRTMPFAEVERSEIYNEFYRPMGLAHGISAAPFNDGRQFGVFSAKRVVRAGPFRVGDIALFERLAPHVTRALQVRRQMARAEAVAGGLAVALDHFSMAVLLVGEQAEVVALNRMAEALLRQPACPLRLGGGRLCAEPPGNAPLSRAVAAAASLGRGRLSAMSPVLRLAKTDGSGEVGVMVAAARRTETLGLSAERLVLVFVSDPGETPVTAPDLLARQFGLSPAEAEIAARLAAGERVEEIADGRGVSKETVRVQVKRVFDKTATRSQGQIAGLVARSLAALRR